LKAELSCLLLPLAHQRAVRRDDALALIAAELASITISRLFTYFCFLGVVFIDIVKDELVFFSYSFLGAF
jgi:hypothetical protein